ncbi:MAG: HAD family hydrolase [Verrucomicrobiota bacterium]
MNKALTHLVFDLDGTLVQMDERKVEWGYMRKAIPRFARLISPFRFRKAFWKSADAMLRNDSSKTNFEAYVDALAAHSPFAREKVERTARLSIEEDFASLGAFIEPVPGARETLALAVRLGYRLVVATNPVFPLSAVLTRMKHGGVSSFGFDYITHAEVMTRCKPRVEFYRELLEKLDVKGAQCLMIGNDPRKDLTAKEVGMRTFLLNRDVGNENLDDDRVDELGDYHDLQQLLETERFR